MTDVVEVVDQYLETLGRVLKDLDRGEISRLIDILQSARVERRTVFIFGNGGSAATASHIACDLNKGADNGVAPRFKVLSLSDNVPTMMALANDMSYVDIFAEPLKNFLKKGDVAIGISGSGNSPNVLKAITYANENGGISVGITGYQGGKLKSLASHSVNVRYNDMQISEDIHLILGHILMKVFCALPDGVCRV